MSGGWLAASAVRFGRPSGRVILHFAIGVAIAATYGIVDEIHQLWTPGRSGADIFDWIADLLGSSTGALLAYFTYGHLERLVTRD